MVDYSFKGDLPPCFCPLVSAQCKAVAWLPPHNLLYFNMAQKNLQLVSWPIPCCIRRDHQGLCPVLPPYAPISNTYPGLLPGHLEEQKKTSFRSYLPSASSIPLVGTLSSGFLTCLSLPETQSTSPSHSSSGDILPGPRLLRVKLLPGCANCRWPEASGQATYSCWNTLPHIEADWLLSP